MIPLTPSPFLFLKPLVGSEIIVLFRAITEGYLSPMLTVNVSLIESPNRVKSINLFTEKSKRGEIASSNDSLVQEAKTIKTVNKLRTTNVFIAIKLKFVKREADTSTSLRCDYNLAVVVLVSKIFICSKPTIGNHKDKYCCCYRSF